MSNWSLVAGQSANSFPASGSYSFITATLPNTPTPGDVVCVSTLFVDGAQSTPPTVNINDENGKVYQITPHSPSTDPSNQSGIIWLAYLLVPSGAGKTINVQFSRPATFTNIYVDQFHLSSGVITFDDDLAGTGSGTTPNTPIVPVHSSDALLFSGMTVFAAITSCDAPWTIDPSGIDPVTSGSAEYLLGASGNQAVAYTVNTSGFWSGMGMSFKSGPDKYTISRKIVRSTQPA